MFVIVHRSTESTSSLSCIAFSSACRLKTRKSMAEFICIQFNPLSRFILNVWRSKQRNRKSVRQKFQSNSNAIVYIGRMGQSLVASITFFFGVVTHNHIDERLCNPIATASTFFFIRLTLFVCFRFIAESHIEYRACVVSDLMFSTHQTPKKTTMKMTKGLNSDWLVKMWVDKREDATMQRQTKRKLCCWLTHTLNGNKPFIWLNSTTPSQNVDVVSVCFIVVRIGQFFTLTFIDFDEFIFWFTAVINGNNVCAFGSAWHFRAEKKNKILI